MENSFVQFSRGQNFYSVRDDIAKQKWKLLLEVEVFVQKGLDETIFHYVEEKLCDFLFEQEKAIYLWKMVENNKYNYYFIVSQEKTLKESIDYALNEFIELSYAIHTEKFSKKYIEVLLPTNKEKQESLNLENLAELDINLKNKEKKVLFFISYKQTKLADFFKKALSQHGFTIDVDGKGRSEKFPKALRITKSIFIDAHSITQETNILIDLCDEYHFLFEWWLCKE